MTKNASIEEFIEPVPNRGATRSVTAMKQIMKQANDYYSTPSHKTSKAIAKRGNVDIISHSKPNPYVKDYYMTQRSNKRQSTITHFSNKAMRGLNKHIEFENEHLRNPTTLYSRKMGRFVFEASNSPQNKLIMRSNISPSTLQTS